MPRGIGGTEADPQTFYVYVIADPQGTTDSGAYPNNDGSVGFFGGDAYENATYNPGGGTIQVFYREPSLVVSSLVVPSTPPDSGSTIPVTWTVSNIGSRDTHESYWIDNIYLSMLSFAGKHLHPAGAKSALRHPADGRFVHRHP